MRMGVALSGDTCAIAATVWVIPPESQRLNRSKGGEGSIYWQMSMSLNDG